MSLTPPTRQYPPVKVIQYQCLFGPCVLRQVHWLLGVKLLCRKHNGHTWSWKFERLCSVKSMFPPSLNLSLCARCAGLGGRDVQIALYLVFKDWLLFVRIHVHLYVRQLKVSAQGECLVSWTKLELWAVVSNCEQLWAVWVLGMELRSSARATRTSNDWAIAPSQGVLFPLSGLDCDKEDRAI